MIVVPIATVILILILILIATVILSVAGSVIPFLTLSDFPCLRSCFVHVYHHMRKHNDELLWLIAQLPSPDATT